MDKQKRTTYIYTCPQCNREYKTTHKHQKTCSKKCMALSFQKPKTKEVKTIYKCVDCGLTLERYGKRCIECNKKKNREKSYQSFLIRPFHERSCKWCGALFTPERLCGNYECCCPEHKELWAKSMKKSDKHNRKAKIRKAYVAPVSIRDIYQRDKGICQLCGKKVNLKDEWPSLMCASIDHIIPLSLGGTHEPKNVQLAHFMCNTLKGNRSAHEQLRLC